MLGIIIGLGLKDAKLVKSAVQLEAPTRADDYQNVFEKHSSVNTTAPLKVANATSKRFQRWDTLRNTTGSVRDNLQHAKDTYKFHQAKTLSSDLRAKIHDYWQVDAFPEFKKTMHIPKEEWTTYKKKFEYLLAHPNSTKTFVIAFGGSSVTAGHDNFLEEAYPALVRKQLAPIFDLLGVKLQVGELTDVVIQAFIASTLRCILRCSMLASETTPATPTICVWRLTPVPM